MNDTQFRQLAREVRMQTMPSGLLVRVIRGGVGPRATHNGSIVVSIAARAIHGSSDIAVLSKNHARVRVADLMPGLAEGVQLLALGAKALIIVPPRLAFEDGAWPPGLEPGTPLMFMVEIHDVLPQDTTP